MTEKLTTEVKLWRKLELLDYRISILEHRRNVLYAVRERLQASLLTEQKKVARRMEKKNEPSR